MKSPVSLFLAILIFSLSGCTHQLEITNLSQYSNTSIASLPKPLRIGIKSTCSNIDGKILVKRIGGRLKKYNATATTAIKPDNSNIDVLATISVDSDYKGSYLNFLINFPGFLVWAPAWHGYHYTVKHDIVVHLTNAETGEKINSFRYPIMLSVRHADKNRTWTELSWLEWGVIAFVGGVVFIQYDDSVTPLVEAKAGPVLGDLVAQEIVNRLLEQ